MRVFAVGRSRCVAGRITAAVFWARLRPPVYLPFEGGLFVIVTEVLVAGLATLGVPFGTLTTLVA